MPEAFQSSPAALALGPDGPFAAKVPDFAPREVQQRMAAAVEEAIANNEELVVGAGTGISCGGSTMPRSLP